MLWPKVRMELVESLTGMRKPKPWSTASWEPSGSSSRHKMKHGHVYKPIWTRTVTLIQNGSMGWLTVRMGTMVCWQNILHRRYWLKGSRGHPGRNSISMKGPSTLCKDTGRILGHRPPGAGLTEELVLVTRMRIDVPHPQKSGTIPRLKAQCQASQMTRSRMASMAERPTYVF
jgi:hypothetical protein